MNIPAQTYGKMSIANSSCKFSCTNLDAGGHWGVRCNLQSLCWYEKQLVASERWACLLNLDAAMSNFTLLLILYW